MQKRFDWPGFGEVLLVKNRRSRSIRVTITGNNSVRVSLPSWLPYQAGLAFLETKRQWINQHLEPPKVFNDGELIGKAHRLRLIADPQAKAVRTRVTNTEIRINHHSSQSPDAPEVQTATLRAALRALKQEGEDLLPAHLKNLAGRHGFTYRSVLLKKLKARWGSCNHQKDIILNTFLMSLPWALIDYVIIHELVHTKVLHHGPDFWEEFQKHMPDAKQRRKQLKAYHPYF